MLIGIDPLLTADLLHALATMGHGDTIAIVDANYPASRSRRHITLAGATASAALRAILSVMPLDDFAPDPARVMQVVGDPAAIPEAVAEMNTILAALGAAPAATLERHAFYAAAADAFAVVATGDRRFYANVLLAKGVVPPAGDAR